MATTSACHPKRMEGQAVELLKLFTLKFVIKDLFLIMTNKTVFRNSILIYQGCTNYDSILYGVVFYIIKLSYKTTLGK